MQDLMFNYVFLQYIRMSVSHILW